MVDLDTSLEETISSSLIILFKLVVSDNLISRSVRMERLLGMDPRIGGSVILEQGSSISTMRRYPLTLASLVNSWLSLALKSAKGQWFRE
jgi:hypothetical protein